MASGHTDKATIMAETARMLGLDIIVPSKVARGGG